MATKNLANIDAIEKIKELATSIDFALMATKLDKLPLHSIPMSTKKVDSKGNIWFLSGKNSTHNGNINKDPKVQLFYSKTMAMEFLTVYGDAEIIEDQIIIDDLYQSSDDNWFEGKTDPNISAIKVTPEDAHYWDTKDNMFVSLMKMRVGTITGEKKDLGEQGNLDV